jgi:hypothetical protein
MKGTDSTESRDPAARPRCSDPLSPADGWYPAYADIWGYDANGNEIYHGADARGRGQRADLQLRHLLTEPSRPERLRDLV